MARRNTTTSLDLFTPTFVERRFEGETIKLLKAPAIEDATMWKQQCFQAVYDSMRKRLHLGNSDALIRVFSEHFNLQTQTAEESARRVVDQFCAPFCAVFNLRPIVFVDHHRIYQTQVIHRKI